MKPEGGSPGVRIDLHEQDTRVALQIVHVDTSGTVVETFGAQPTAPLKDVRYTPELTESGAHGVDAEAVGCDLDRARHGDLGGLGGPRLPGLAHRGLTAPGADSLIDAGGLKCPGQEGPIPVFRKLLPEVSIPARESSIHAARASRK